MSKERGIFLLSLKNELIRSSEGKSCMRLFQVEGSMNVGMKEYVYLGVGQSVLGIRHLFKLANPKTYEIEGRAYNQKGKLCPDCDRPWYGAEGDWSPRREKLRPCVEAGVCGESLSHSDKVAGNRTREAMTNFSLTGHLDIAWS